MDRAQINPFPLKFVGKSLKLFQLLFVYQQWCSEHNVVVLKGDIERLRQDIALSEKACKAAEVNLSLQNAQHERETAELQRELFALRSRPNLAAALHELEERNNEMEELLKTSVQKLRQTTTEY